MTPRYKRGRLKSDPFYSVPVEVTKEWTKVYDPNGVDEFALFTIEFGEDKHDLYTISGKGKFLRPISRYKSPMLNRRFRKERVKELAALYANTHYEI